MPRAQHLPGVSKKEQRQYEHILKSAKKQANTREGKRKLRLEL